MKEFEENRVMFADSYKYSHPVQFPVGARNVFNYGGARGDENTKILWIGLQLLLKKYFSKPIQQWEVEEAAVYAEAHGIMFLRDEWTLVVQAYGGRIPVTIKALPEGLVCPVGVPNFIYEYDGRPEHADRLFWLVGWFETFLMKVWYPLTVGTKSLVTYSKIDNFLQSTSDNPNPEFMFHLFGDRAATSVEAAAIGGVAHLVAGNLGTDNFNSLRYAKLFYGAKAGSGLSISASEHSTVTSWGQDGRFEMYKNNIEKFKDSALTACVMDSYDIYFDVKFVTSGEFKDKIESDDYPIFVIRPDSGDPLTVIPKLLAIMMANGVAYKVNSKTLKVFDKYKLIWGDGINLDTIMAILEMAKELGFAPDNFAFGCGGELMQEVNRNDHGYAIKASEITIVTPEGKIIRDISKNPITDPRKKSKAGRVHTYLDKDDKIVCKVESDKLDTDLDIMEVTFHQGTPCNNGKFDFMKQLRKETYMGDYSRLRKYM